MTTILTKKSDTPGAVPATANLTNAAGGAELAVNTADKRLFSINSSSSVIEIGTNPSSLTVAGEGSITVFRSESATITNLTATSATIDNFTFTSATVTRLAATSAVITDLSATVGRIGSGTITQLVSTSASISNLSSASASITTLTGTSANITTLTGTTLGYTSGSITNLAVTSLTVSSLSLSNATFTSATITTLKSTSATVDNLASTSANITTLTGTTFGTTATTQLRGASAQITTLTGSSANITTVTGTTAGFSSGNITQFGATSASIGTLTGTSANIATLSGTTLTYGSGSITNLAVTSLTVSSLSLANATFTSATITTLTGTSANITTVTGTTAGFGSANITQLGSTSATIGTLTGTSANITTLSGTTATYGSATVTNLNVTSVTLSNLSIASANITTLTGTNLTYTSGTVTNLNSTSANIGTLTGTTFGTTATTQLRGASAQITTLTATSSNITTLTGTTATFTSATVTNLNLTSLTLGNLSVTSANITTLTSASGTITNLLATTANISGAAVISVNSSSNALRITQTGTGNALLVEDSANPDATPVVIDANGRAIVGTTSNVGLGMGYLLQVADATSLAGLAASNWQANTTGSILVLAKSRGGTVGTRTVVNSGDEIGAISFRGDDGTAGNLVAAAAITASVDGTPGTNDMPGRLVFSTTADGASTPTERLRIDSTGAVGIGTTSLGSGYGLRVTKTLTDVTSGQGVVTQVTANSTITNLFGFNTSLNSATNSGTPYTITQFAHYNAAQGTVNADSTVTNQFGFVAASSLTGATNNYGFYSNIASGTNRWNFYAAGTADNFFGGPTTISVNSSSNALRITQVGAGNALVVEDSANPDSTPVVIDSGGNLIQGNTAVVAGVVTGSLQTQGTGANGSSHNLQAYSASTSGTLEFDRSRGALGAQSVVSSGDRLGRIFFCGSDGAAFIRGAEIYADVDGTPGTNDMPGRLVFGTTADGASSPTERMRIDNAGIVYINTTTNTNSSQLVVSGTISEAVAGTQYLVASQYDIGTDPNEIPLNQYLGALAYVDSEWVAPQVGSGITGGTGTICKTSFAVEGGVKKMQVLIDLTGLNSGGTAGDIIGVNGTANPCYIAQIPSTFTILGGRMTCLETPAGGDTDIDLYSATEGTGVEDQAITALTETQIINAGTQSAGTVTYFAADPAANTYFYLVGQSTSNATYTAGRFLIEVFGA